MPERWIDRIGIALDREADVALGVQLAWALGGAIRSGALARGERLPPLRELSGELGVNLNTLRAVYVRLEAEGLIESRHGSGTFVTGAPGARDLDELVRAAAEAARGAGVAPRDLAAALYVSASRKRDVEAAARSALRQEIAVLERVLSGLRAQPVQAAGRDRGPQLLTLAELEATRDELVGRIAAAGTPPDDEAKPTPPVRVKRAAKTRPQLGPATA